MYACIHSQLVKIRTQCSVKDVEAARADLLRKHQVLNLLPQSSGNLTWEGSAAVRKEMDGLEV